MNIVSKIRQFFCHHQWRPTKFQALVPSTSFECVKCGKLEYRDWSRIPTKSSGTSAIRQRGESDG